MPAFIVTGIVEPVTSATLRPYVTNGSTNGSALYPAGNLWLETGITWSTKPARTSGVIDNRASVAANAWIEYDVRSVVTANGTYTFNLVPETSDGITMNSGEAARTRRSSSSSDQ